MIQKIKNWFNGKSEPDCNNINVPPPPIILAKGVVKVTFNNTVEKELNDGTAYHEQTLGFSVSDPLDYMAIMGTKRESKYMLEFRKEIEADRRDMLETLNVMREVHASCYPS